MDTIAEKTDVFNTIRYRNTVGEELLEIFGAHGINDGDSRMGIRNLASKEKLTAAQINRACSILGIGEGLKASLLSFQNDYLQDKIKCNKTYRQSKRNFTRLKGVVPLLKGEFNSGIDKINDILDFFGVDNEKDLFQETEKTAALFRQQNVTNVNPINLKGWLRRGELDYMKLNLPPYDAATFTNWIEGREWENHLNNPDYFKRLPDILGKYGVALVLVPYMPKTVYGAVRWMDGHPLIEISDRNRDLATCWFTLFHEFGHVLKHRDIEILEGDLNESKAKLNLREREANKFANSYLFKGDSLRKAVFERKRANKYMTSQSLAEEFGVDKIFTSYWLTKAQYAPTFQPHISISFADSYQ